MKLTMEEKEARKLARRQARQKAETETRINDEKNQKPVRSMTITVEWKRSQTWGSNPNCEARVQFQDGTHETSPTYRCSGCGYDKESMVIADVFNAYLKYKLWMLTPEQRKGGNRSKDDRGAPYGVLAYSEDRPHFGGGIGTDCYYAISKYIGGKFEKISSGKRLDVYQYTDGIFPDTEGKVPASQLETASLVAMMGEVLCNTQEEKNTWKKRMLSTVDGIQFPDDFDSLPEEEKARRLNNAIDPK